MAERDFAAELEGLFDTPPRVGGEEAFARKVERRVAGLLWTRRLVYGSAFLVGGAVAVSQLARPSLWSGMSEALAPSLSLPSVPPAGFDPALAMAAAILLGVLVYTAHVLREA